MEVEMRVHVTISRESISCCRNRLPEASLFKKKHSLRFILTLFFKIIETKNFKSGGRSNEKVLIGQCITHCSVKMIFIVCFWWVWFLSDNL